MKHLVCTEDAVLVQERMLHLYCLFVDDVVATLSMMIFLRMTYWYRVVIF